jgi:sugar phosphate isomerase/epimerase
MKISILSYSFHGLVKAGMQDVFGYLESCKYRYNLDAADLWSGHFPTTDEEFVQQIKESLDEREMVLADIAVDQAHVWEEDPDQREEHYRRAKRFLEIAATLGANFVRIDAGGSRETLEWTDEQFDFIAKRYQEYAQYAHDHGFKIGMENHWGPEKIYRNLKKMYDAVDHPAFGVSMHLSSWLGTEEEQEKSDEWCAPIASHTHLAWYVCQNEKVQLEDKLRLLDAAGYEGYYSVEHHSAQHEYERVAMQLAGVREGLHRIRAEKAGS